MIQEGSCNPLLIALRTTQSNPAALLELFSTPADNLSLPNQGQGAGDPPPAAPSASSSVSHEDSKTFDAQFRKPGTTL